MSGRVLAFLGSRCWFDREVELFLDGLSQRAPVTARQVAGAWAVATPDGAIRLVHCTAPGALRGRSGRVEVIESPLFDRELQRALYDDVHATANYINRRDAA